MSKQHYLCSTCDSLLQRTHLSQGTRALCPCCHSRIYDEPHSDLSGLTALTLAALLFYFPANGLPILEIDLIGNLRSTNALLGALSLLDKEFWLVGIAVLVAGVIAPLLLLLSVLAQLLLLQLRQGQNIVRLLLKWHGTLKQLSMIEIYMISVLVSIFKLVDIASITYGWGTLCYALLFIFTFYVQYEYNPEIMWQYYDDAYQK